MKRYDANCIEREAGRSLRYNCIKREGGHSLRYAPIDG